MRKGLKSDLNLNHGKKESFGQCSGERGRALELGKAQVAFEAVGVARAEEGVVVVAEDDFLQVRDLLLRATPQVALHLVQHLHENTYTGICTGRQMTYMNICDVTSRTCFCAFEETIRCVRSVFTASANIAKRWR